MFPSLSPFLVYKRYKSLNHTSILSQFAFRLLTNLYVKPLLHHLETQNLSFIHLFSRLNPSFPI
ncbi:MAG: hypothetical protein ACTS4U_00030 [Candidatus Hodgkinia cicadicola]